jgi:UDPglucose--hexose-1-phosphate uridylyltransferase
LCDLLKHELSKGTRIIDENEHFVSFVPFFARFAYETFVVPRRQVPAITDLSKDEMAALASMLKNILVKFDNLYGMNFPNNTILLNAPTDGAPENSLFHFHIEFYPPLRSGDKQKFLAGFDLGGGNIINSVEPEMAAWQMRNASSVKSS